MWLCIFSGMQFEDTHAIPKSRKIPVFYFQKSRYRYLSSIPVYRYFPVYRRGLPSAWSSRTKLGFSNLHFHTWVASLNVHVDSSHPFFLQRRPSSGRNKYFRILHGNICICRIFVRKCRVFEPRLNRNLRASCRRLLQNRGAFLWFISTTLCLEWGSL